MSQSTAPSAAEVKRVREAAERLLANVNRVVVGKAETIRLVFIALLCGGHVLPIYDGCLTEGIRDIDVRHEQAAAHAADACARLTRGLGVAIVTAGPGVTDAVTGVVNYVLKQDFEGLQLDAQTGISSSGDGTTRRYPRAASSTMFHRSSSRFAAASRAE